MIWTDQEIKFLLERLNKSPVDIYEDYLDNFLEPWDNIQRSYDSIQKKARELRNRDTSTSKVEASPPTNRPKILLLDIETRPALAYVWRLFKENIGVEQIVESIGLLCFSAQWYGTDDVIFKSEWEDGKEETVKVAYELLNEADIIVHYYGSAFDIPILHAEFLQRGWKPPVPFYQVDLKKVVEKVMKTTSNRLAFIGPFLGIGDKVKHEGFGMWRGVLEGDIEQQEKMKEYNIQDTRMLGPLYERLLPWIQDHPNIGKFTETASEKLCTRCGSDNLQSRGYRHATTYSYKRYQCMDCGGWQRDRSAIKESSNQAVMRGI